MCILMLRCLSTFDNKIQRNKCYLKLITLSLTAVSIVVLSVDFVVDFSVVFTFSSGFHFQCSVAGGDGYFTDMARDFLERKLALLAPQPSVSRQ